MPQFLSNQTFGSSVSLVTPTARGTVNFQASGGAPLSHIDGTTGNYVNDRADGQSVFIGASAGPVVSTGTLNTLVGYQAGAALTTGFNNTVLGAKSLANATTACNYNVGIGYFNLNGIVANCSGNVAIGEAAGNANTSGNNNTYVGTFADASGGGFSHSTALGAGAQITASNQIVLGTASETVLSIAGVPYTWPTSAAAGVLTSTSGGALSWAAGISNPNPTFIITTSSQFNMGGPLYFYNSSGTTRLSQIDNATGNFVNARPDTTCVFLGVNAGKNFVSATLTNNVFIGRLAGQAVTDLQSNANNTVVGSQALSQAGTISGVTAIGSQSLMSVTGSCLNDTAVGYQAMLNAATACNTNTAVGYQAMQGSAAYGTSSNNTAVGVNALGAIQSNMAGNTALGSQSGSVSSLLANSNNNTYLGYNAGSSGGNNPTNCTYVGANTSDVSSTSYNQSTALGCNAKITASNQIVLGTSSEGVVIPGNTLSVRGVPYTWPSGGQAGMLQNDGSGNLSWLGDALAPLASPTISLGSGSTVSAVNLGRVNICGDATGNYTLTLPPASGNGGKFIRFQMAPTLTKLVTIAGNGSDKIDGAASRIMWANEVADLFCDGTKWTKVAGKSIPMICAIYRAAALSIANNAVTTIPFDSVISDPTGMMADVTVNRRINFQRPGTYLVQGGVSYQHLSAYTNNVQGSIRLSGTLQAQGVVTNAIASGVVSLCFGGISAVSAGQYLDQYGYQFNTEAIAVDLFVGGTVNFLSAIEILQW